MIAVSRSECIARQADVIAAFTLDVLKGTQQAFDPSKVFYICTVSSYVKLVSYRSNCRLMWCCKLISILLILQLFTVFLHSVGLAIIYHFKLFIYHEKSSFSVEELQYVQSFRSTNT